MKRTETMSIGDVLRQALEDNCMQGQLDRVRAADLWSLVVGEAISRQTTRPNVSGSVMTVGVPNAALRHELTMHRTSIAREINRQLGKEVLTDIRFVS